MFEILVTIFKTLTQIWSSLSESQKDSICKAFTELMESVFREWFRANTGAAQ